MNSPVSPLNASTSGDRTGSFLWLVRRQIGMAFWKCLMLAAVAIFVFHAADSLAEDLSVDAVKLPPLTIDGRSARAHTQGLEIQSGKYYVTARRNEIADLTFGSLAQSQVVPSVGSERSLSAYATAGASASTKKHAFSISSA